MKKNIRLQPLLDMNRSAVLGYEALYTKGIEKEYPSAEQILKSVASAFGFQGNFQLFINMTVKDAIEKEFSRNFLQALYKLGIDGRRIVLEVSENTYPDMIPEVHQTLLELRKHGVKIALDDFGSQYSVFDFIQKLPLDIVKIDKNIVQKSSSNSKESAILKFYVDIFHDIGCQVVAEGIETIEHLNCAHKAKVDIAQGFLFSAPSLNVTSGQSSPFICLSDFVVYASSITAEHQSQANH